ncbi:MAG TPA: GNAT family N-acetyltransferase [Flavipsychrobacter sp.]|nr:GNAT family N-acetyltransferase [Flavipsychrobacter sp.]
MMDIQLVKDAALLLPLSRQLQQLHQHAFPHIFKAFDEKAVAEYFRGCIADNSYRHYAAFEGNVACGYVQVQQIIRPESAFVAEYSYLHIHQLMVDVKYRQKGVGMALIEEVFTFANEIGCSRVDLTVWNFNNVAQKLFKKAGFTEDLHRMYINL